jgi:hypothetical protein
MVHGLLGMCQFEYISPRIDCGASSGERNENSDAATLHYKNCRCATAYLCVRRVKPN